jgi:hypothetical protein
MSDTNFDYEIFHDLLLDALRQGFLGIQEEHLDEAFYMFAVLISAEGNDLCMMAETEEGLHRRAEADLDHLKKMGWAHDFDGITFDEVKESMRFETPSYFCEAKYQDLLSDINNVLMSTSMSRFRAYYELAKKVGGDEARKVVEEPHWDKFTAECVRVFKQLDAEGIFSKRQPRQNITLGYVIGDIDPLQFLHVAAELNPPEIVERLQIANTVFEDVVRREQENRARRKKKKQ